MEIVVAVVESFKKHPEAIRLNICQVFDGVKTVQVVCGASNLKVGMKTILAKVGSTTPKGIQIKETLLREVLSSGMLCSAKDLNVSNEDGIIDLPDSVTLGEKLQNIDPRLLSSIPWHSFKLVDQIYENPTTSKLEIHHSHKDLKLISETYFDSQNEKYLYRHYL